jgi:hypothetical protein
MAFTKRVYEFASFAAAARVCAAVCTHLGYPKVEGNPLDENSPPARRVRFFVRPKRVPVGHPLRALGVVGVVVVPIDHPLIAPLHGMVLPIPETYDGIPVPQNGTTTVTINLNAGRPFSKATDNDLSEEDF